MIPRIDYKEFELEKVIAEGQPVIITGFPLGYEVQNIDIKIEIENLKIFFANFLKKFCTFLRKSHYWNLDC